MVLFLCVCIQNPFWNAKTVKKLDSLQQRPRWKKMMKTDFKERGKKCLFFYFFCGGYNWQEKKRVKRQKQRHFCNHVQSCFIHQHFCLVYFCFSDELTLIFFSLFIFLSYKWVIHITWVMTLSECVFHISVFIFLSNHDSFL